MEIDEIKNLTNGTDILNDIYDLISDIEVEIGEGSVGNIRQDSFYHGIETIFKPFLGETEQNVDIIEDIETKINEKENNELYIIVLEDIKEKIIDIYDRYLGVKLNYDNTNDKPSLDNLYSIYKVLYLNEWNMLGKILAYVIMKPQNKGVYDLSVDTVFEDIIRNTDEFNFDTIPQILNIMDMGNADYEYVFGSVVQDNESMGEELHVSFIYDGWINHILKELRQGAGVLNTQLLREEIEKSCNYIRDNKIL